MATRVANRLNLNGPAISIHTACSTALVAIAQAWHALAGRPVRRGARRRRHVSRAAAEAATCTSKAAWSRPTATAGRSTPMPAARCSRAAAAVVVLKRLEDAQADGDTVYAVIRGVGAEQRRRRQGELHRAERLAARPPRSAWRWTMRGVDARSIGYVEAHGTGTSLGDPIEVAALTRAYRDDTADAGYCGLGSLKSNLGHLVAAAGVAGLIKAALALHRDVDPGHASLSPRRTRRSTSRATPFRVVAENTPWPRGQRAAPRGGKLIRRWRHQRTRRASRKRRRRGRAERRSRALVGAAAVGSNRRRRGCNVRPIWPTESRRTRRWRSPTSHRTLMRGRKPLAQRLAVVARHRAAAVAALRTRNRTRAQRRVSCSCSPGRARSIRAWRGDCTTKCRHFARRWSAVSRQRRRSLSVSLRRWLLNAASDDSEAGERLAETRYAQPALFAMSYALARPGSTASAYSPTP